MSLPATLTTAIPVFEYGHFAFAASQQATNVFLMGKYYHQCYCNGKYPIDMIVYIENDENKNGKSDTGHY